jgi:DNA-directed RNA polymerase specialized sigma24 family protein
VLRGKRLLLCGACTVMLAPRRPHVYRIVLSLDELGPGGTLPLMAVDSLTPEDVAVRAELASAIANAVATLPKPLNDVFTRCTVSGLSIRETAKALGLTVQATKTRLFRARSRTSAPSSTPCSRVLRSHQRLFSGRKDKSK